MTIEYDKVSDLLNRLRRNDQYWSSDMLESHDDITINQLLIGGISHFATSLNLKFCVTDERDATHHILIFKKDEVGGDFVTGANGDLLWCVNEVLSCLMNKEIELIAEQL